MLTNVIRNCVLVVSVFVAQAAFAANVPTLDQVREAAQGGRLNDAHSMMQQVLKEHPNSAKAHFVDAEILAKMGRMSDARGELHTAERLQPGLTGENPESVQKLKAMVGEGSSALTAVSTSGPASHSGFPWSLVILAIAAIAVIALIMRAFARPSAAPAPYAGNPGNYPGGYQPGVGPGYGAAPAAPGMGSTILTGLATGAAVGAGMVAGEALAHRLMDGDHGSAGSAQPMTDASYSQTGANTQSYDMGGNDFGVNDTSTWDDSSIVADNSSGGDDWT